MILDPVDYAEFIESAWLLSPKAFSYGKNVMNVYEFGLAFLLQIMTPYSSSKGYP